MAKPLEKGGFVVHESHPEHGLGRVISIGAFATRVLFTRGGVRVYRAEHTMLLKGVTSPAAADVAQLEAKELAFASGHIDAPAAAAARAEKPSKRRTKAAAPS